MGKNDGLAGGIKWHPDYDLVRYPAEGDFMSDATAREMFNVIEAGNLERVRALVSAEPSLIGAIVDNADPLGWAAFYAHPDIVEYFIQAGSDLNWRTSRG